MGLFRNCNPLERKVVLSGQVSRFLWIAVFLKV
jgi:hypothetical protein